MPFNFQQYNRETNTNKSQYTSVVRRSANKQTNRYQSIYMYIHPHNMQGERRKNFEKLISNKIAMKLIFPWISQVSRCAHQPNVPQPTTQTVAQQMGKWAKQNTEIIIVYEYNILTYVYTNIYICMCSYLPIFIRIFTYVCMYTYVYNSRIDQY